MRWLLVSLVALAAMFGMAAAQDVKSGLFDLAAPRVAPEDVARAIEAEGRKKPEILFALAMAAFSERRKHESELSDAVLEYFASYLVRMRHVVWIGDVKRDRTAFAFVDYSSPAAGLFLKGLESFSKKDDVRIVVLPSSIDEKSRAAALTAASAAATSGAFAPFAAALEKKGAEYSGDPLEILDESSRKAVIDGEAESDVIEQVAVVRLVAIALDLPQPLALVMNSQRYVGDVSDGDEMMAFFAPPPAKGVGGSPDSER